MADRHDTDGEAVELAQHESIAPSTPRTGQSTGASGGYGTGSGGEAAHAEVGEGPSPIHEPDGGSDRPTSGGTGEGDAATSTAGEETETGWLRSGPGGDAR
jgi:hypothetical protein